MKDDKKGNSHLSIQKFFYVVYWTVCIIAKILFLSVKIFFCFCGRILEALSEQMRFSLTFRITATYVLLFFTVFLLMSVGIIASFNYFIKEYPPENYVFLLGTILTVFGIVGIVAIILLGSRASRRLLAPIKTMTNAVREISLNQLDRRLEVRGSKTELKDLAQTFNDMMDRIQKSVQQQNRFVSDASHELRTPISVIQGYTNLLARWGKDDRKVLEESISALQSEAESMNRLIENLLFLARDDSGTLEVTREQFNIKEIIDEILYETSLLETDHKILSEKREDLIVSADRKLIKEAVRILVDNSIKYTPSGGAIKLNCYMKNRQAIISVEDNGMGISKEDLPNIFTRFYRADESRAKENGGTGLGLAIAKLIIDSHQGRIRVWSEPGEGTIFRIQLPLGETSAS